MQKELIKSITMLQKGDTNAFEEIYIQTNRFVYEIIKQTSNFNDEDVYDLMQETYIKVFQNINSLKNPKAFLGWIKKIAINITISKIRIKNPALLSCSADSDDDNSYDNIITNIEETNDSFIPEQAIDSNETQTIVMNIINSLPYDQRLCIIMYYFDDLSIKEIAKTLDLKENNIYQKLHTAKKYIKSEVEKLEKANNIRIHSLIPLGFFQSVISASVKEFSKNAVMPAAPVISSATNETVVSTASSAGTLSASSSVVTGTGLTGKLTTAFFSSGFLGKTVLIIVTSIAVIGTGLGISSFFNNDNSNLIMPMPESSYEDESGELDALPDNRNLSNIPESSDNSNSNNPNFNIQSNTSRENSQAPVNSRSNNPIMGNNTSRANNNVVNNVQNNRANNGITSSNTNQSSSPASSDSSDSIDLFNSSQAAPKEDFDYYLETYEEGICLTKYNGSAETLIIPEKIDGYPVTSLYSSSESFLGNTNQSGTTRKIYIPKTIRSIYANFNSESGSTLEYIYIDPENEYYSSKDGILFDKRKTKLLQYPLAKTGKNYEISNNITEIGDHAFYNCQKLTNIVLPNGIIRIGASAFYNCQKLTNIVLPNSITTIDDSAFYNCRSLNNITLPNSITKISTSAFEECYSLSNITIPNSITTIDGFAFRNCENLTNITLPNSITTIDWYAFAGCESLLSIKLPNSIKTIDSNVFYNCKNLNNITLPNSVTKIGDSAFECCSCLKNITIPNSVTTIGRSAFQDCSALSSITLPSSITTIGDSAFHTRSFEDLTIIGEKGSYAETYANENNITFKEQ